MSQELDIIHSEIDEMHSNMLKEERNKMPEGVFKEFFLPYFNGNEEIVDDNPIMAKWVEFSGSVYHSVDLINGEGKVVDTVPPLIVNTEANREKSANIDYGVISSEFNLRSKRSPVNGDSYLEKTLSAVGNELSDTSTDNEKEWHGLLKRYGTGKGVEKSTGMNVKADEDVSDMLDYD